MTSCSHIYWFSFSNKNAVSARYRALYVLEKLKDEGSLTYSFAYPGYSLKDIYNFLKTYFQALLFRKKDSYIMFQMLYTRRIYSNALKLLILLRRKRSLYDIDDAEYIRFTHHTVHFFLKRVSKVSVGSKALLDYCSKFNNNVYLFTTPIIQHNWQKKAKNKVLTIGWIGYFNAHKESIETQFLPALKNIKFNIKIVFLGVRFERHRQFLINYFKELYNIELLIPQDINWLDEDSVYERVKEFDIGIAPLIDTPFNRAKSAFKLKQYFSCGVPALGSKTGENEVFLKDNQNGFICESPIDYKNKIEYVNSINQKEYESFIQNALKTYPTFSLELHCKRFKNILMNDNY